MNATVALPDRMTASNVNEPAHMSANAAQPSFMLQTRALRRMLDAKTIAATSKKTGQRTSATTPCAVRAA